MGKELDLKLFIPIGLFILSMIGAVGSYFKSMSDIRQEIQTAIYSAGEKIRVEMRDQYATKESSYFVNNSLAEIKTDLKEIKAKIDRK